MGLVVCAAKSAEPAGWIKSKRFTGRTFLLIPGLIFEATSGSRAMPTRMGRTSEVRAHPIFVCPVGKMVGKGVNSLGKFKANLNSRFLTRPLEESFELFALEEMIVGV